MLTWTFRHEIGIQESWNFEIALEIFNNEGKISAGW